MGVTGGKEMTMSGLDGDFSSAQRKGGGENRIQLSWSLQTYLAAGTGRLGAEEGAVTVALAVGDGTAQVTRSGNACL